MTRILLAEDNPVLLKDIAYILELHGYEVIQVKDEQSAYQILDNTTSAPDVIVSNIGLLNTEEVTVFTYFKDGCEINIPILFMMAFNSPDIAYVSQKMAVGDYIVKPFLVDDLVVSIENKLKS